MKSLGLALVALLVGAVVLLSALLVPERAADETAAPQGGAFRFSVTVAPVAPGVVEESVILVGDVVSARRTALAFETAGRISEITADHGASLERGQVLARLASEVLEEEWSAAQAAEAAAAAQAEYAGREARRAQEVGADIVGEAEQDRLQFEALRSQRLLEQRQAETRRLQALLARHELRAPFAAVVNRRWVSEGAYVQAGDAAFEVVDLQRREAHLEVPAAVAAQLAPGATVRLSADEHPDFVVAAAVDVLLPAADPAHRSFTAIVRLPPDADPDHRFLPGMFVRAQVSLRKVDAATVVPEDSLLGGAQGTVVVVAAAGAAPDEIQALFVPVRVLARAGGRAAVQAVPEEALAAGAQVLVSGADNVFPGAPLLVHPAEAVAAAPGGPP